MSSRGFGPSPLIMTALAAQALCPALLILSVRQLWPQLWVNVAVAGVGICGVAMALWFFRRGVSTLSSGLWVIAQVRPSGDAAGFVGLFVTPCLIALACTPSTRWLALAVLVLFGFLAVRTSAVLTNNPLLTLIGVYTFQADIHRLTGSADEPQNVTLLARNATLYVGERVRLVGIGHGVHVHVATAELADA